MAVDVNQSGSKGAGGVLCLHNICSCEHILTLRRPGNLSNFSYPGYENDAEGATTYLGSGSNVCPKGPFLDGWQAWTINCIGMGKRGFAVI